VEASRIYDSGPRGSGLRGQDLNETNCRWLRHNFFFSLLFLYFFFYFFFTFFFFYFFFSLYYTGTDDLLIRLIVLILREKGCVRC
jgi:hypothetical protein